MKYTDKIELLTNNLVKNHGKVHGPIQIKSLNCVNSKWPARWVAGEQESCQCGFKCKLSIIYRGHTFVVTKKELGELYIKHALELIDFN